MAIVNGIQAFHYYLYGRKFTILSDSRPLKFFAKSSSPTDLVTRWLIKLSEYSYTFQYLPGKKNLLADLFSRVQFQNENISDLNNNPDIINSNEVLPITIQQDCQTPPKHVHNINISVQPKEDPLLEISCDTILKEQLKDQKLSKIYNDLVDNIQSSKTKNYIIDPNTMLLLHAKERTPAQSPNIKIVLPKSLQPKALRIAHMGHLGIKKTFQNLQMKYCWQGSYADTCNYVNSCEICLKVKHHKIPHAPFQNNPIPKHPGDFISLDIVGPFSNSFYILTIIDHFSRYLSLHPLKTITAENVVKCLFEYITVHGRPSLILTDLGRQFTSNIFQTFNRKFGIRLIFTSINHPQTNSLSERINTQIKTTIAALQCEGYNFENSVRIHQMLYNSSIHSTTESPPNLIHFGRHLSTLYDTYVVSDENVILNSNRIYYQLIKDLQAVYDKIYSNLITAQKLQNENQQGAKLRKIKINDIVYLKSNHQLKKSYLGPFQVVHIISPVTVRIQRYGEPKAPIMTIHIDRLWIAPKRRLYLNEPSGQDQVVNDQQRVQLQPTPNVSSNQDANSNIANPDHQMSPQDVQKSVNSPDEELHTSVSAQNSFSFNSNNSDMPARNAVSLSEPNSPFSDHNDPSSEIDQEYFSDCDESFPSFCDDMPSLTFYNQSSTSNSPNNSSLSSVCYSPPHLSGPY